MRHVTNHREPLAQYWDVTAPKEPKQPMLVVSYQGLAPTRHQLVSYRTQASHGKLPLLLQLCVLQGTRRSSLCDLYYGIYGVCIGILACRGLSLVSSPLHAMKSQSQIQSSAVEAGHRIAPIPRRLDSPTFQATKLPELGLTLTPTTGREHSQEINNLSIPALTSQAPGPSQKRSRSPSSPFFPDATTFSDGKPAYEASELNPEDVTARLEDLEVEIDTLHADTEDKELLIAELQDSIAAAESEIAILQIRANDAESRRAEDHEQIQKILARLNL
ncbi:hypothetical protein Tco_0612729 [Tanacetum coccineum]